MIVVVGDVMTDVIVRPEGDLVRGTDRRATITRQPGGSGANIACWLGHLGVVTRFAGRVGVEDHAAQSEHLRAHGVQPHLAADAGTPTGTVVAVVTGDGERSFFTDRGANLNLTTADLPTGLLEGARALHLSGHVFFAPGPRAAARALLDAALAAGIEVSVDAGSAGWLAEAGATAFLSWTRGATLCFANADEAALLGGGFPLFVTTMGADGAAAWEEGEAIRVPSQMVSATDSTGAGDAFAAGFLAARQAGRTTLDCLMDATTIAARCVGQAGGRPVATP